MKIYKKICVLFVLIGTLIGVGFGTAHAEEYLGDMYSSSTIAMIDCEEIPVYTYNDYPYVIAEDLNGYGFDVKWNAIDKTLYVDYNADKQFYPYDDYNIYFSLASDKVSKVYSSEIKVKLQGVEIPSYSLNGRMLISIDELWRLGSVNWYNESHTISFTSYKFLENNPDWEILVPAWCLWYCVCKANDYGMGIYRGMWDDILFYREGRSDVISDTWYYQFCKLKMYVSDILLYIENNDLLYNRGLFWHFVYNSIPVVSDDLQSYKNNIYPEFGWDDEYKIKLYNEIAVYITPQPKFESWL